MWPAPFGIPSPVIVLPLAVLAGAWFPLAYARRAGYAWPRLALFLAGLGLAGLAGAKLYSVLERGWTDGAWITELKYGYRYPGGMLAVLLAAGALAWVLPRGLTLRRTLDYCAPGIAAAMAVVRIDCLLGGCCTGSICRLPWCFSYPMFSAVWEQQLAAGVIDGAQRVSLPVHPLQLYLLLLSAALAVFLARQLRHAAWDGQVILTYFAIYDSGKFLLESLREPPVPYLQIASLAIAGMAITLLLAGARAHRPVRAGTAHAPAVS